MTLHDVPPPRGRKLDLENAQLVVRPAGSGDAEVLKRLRLASLQDSPGAFASTLERELAFDDDVWGRRFQDNLGRDRSAAFIAEVGGEAVGVAVGVRDDPLSDTAYLNAMWVAPTIRGRGAGALLVGAVADWAALRFRFLRLGVTDGNPAALGLYRACGFVEVAEPYPKRMGGDQCAVTMVFELPAADDNRR